MLVLQQVQVRAVPPVLAEVRGAAAAHVVEAALYVEAVAARIRLRQVGGARPHQIVRAAVLLGEVHGAAAVARGPAAAVQRVQVRRAAPAAAGLALAGVRPVLRTDDWQLRLRVDVVAAGAFADSESVCVYFRFVAFGRSCGRRVAT